MAKRDAYVARGVSLAPIVAAHGHGARLTDVDGKEYIDFAGGIGVLNLGHTPDAVVDAIKRQAEAMLHSCFPVAAYEPYLDVAQLLCEHSPGSHAKKACAPHRAEANRSTGTEPISPVEQPGQGVSADDEQVSSGDVGPQTS